MTYQEILNGIQTGQITGEGLYKKRQSLIRNIESKTKRPLAVYSAKIDAERGSPNQIVLEDVVAFSDLIANLDGKKIDILIESPGGDLGAAQRIVELLRSKFDDIRFIVPGSAYSAATMIVLSGDKILMDKRGALGPIDPQINGVPARSILNGFDRIRELLKKDGPASLAAYLPLIQKYDLHIFEICRDVEERGKQVVKEWLKNYMFKGKKIEDEKIGNIVSFFSDYDSHKSHSRPIFLQEVQDLGVEVVPLDEKKDIHGWVWDLFLCFKIMHDLTPNIKLFENSKGINWGKQYGQVVQQQIIQPPRKKV